MEVLQMSKKELNQVGVFERLKNKEMKQKEAALILSLSERQTREKLRKFRLLGPPSLIHRLRGRPSNNQLDSRIVKEALNLVGEKYPDFGPTLASEKLEEIHNIKVNHETLRLKMIEAGLWKKRESKPVHRKWRERKECLGELVQLDGSDHDWFENGQRCNLLAFIDDATSKILHLEFAPETTLGVMKATKKYIAKHGFPTELYFDRGKVFKVNLGNPDGDRLTQYERTLKELNIKATHARSPQAKGRVERLFGTLQDRLVKEMRLGGIKTVKKANEFLKNEYLPKHNQKYAKEPKSKANLHQEAKGCDLANALCIKEKRVLTNDFTLRYKNQWFQLKGEQKTILFPKDEITVVTHMDGKTNLFIRKTKLFFHKIDKPAIKEIVKINILGSRKPWAPSVDHPWRKLVLKSKKAEVSTLQKAEVSTLV